MSLSTKKTLLITAAIALSGSTAAWSQGTSTAGDGTMTVADTRQDDDGDKWGWLGLLGLAGLLGLKRRDHDHDHRTTTTSTSGRL
jgi:MYXO-CTERM domain-containing protein